MITITWYKVQLKEGRFIASVAAVSFPFLGDRKSVRVSGRAGGGWDLNAVMFSSRVFFGKCPLRRLTNRNIPRENEGTVSPHFLLNILMSYIYKS